MGEYSNIMVKYKITIDADIQHVRMYVSVNVRIDVCTYVCMNQCEYVLIYVHLSKGNIFERNKARESVSEKVEGRPKDLATSSSSQRRTDSINTLQH